MKIEKSIIRKCILVTSFILGFNFKSHAKFQVGTLAFTSQKTSTVGLNFLLQSGASFRFFSGFIFQSGGTPTMQGEFTLGGIYYPLNSLTKSFAQPFVGVGGFIGLGQADPSTPDTGYDLTVGVDLKILKRHGITIKVDSHISTTPDQRLALAFIIKCKIKIIFLILTPHQ